MPIWLQIILELLCAYSVIAFIMICAIMMLMEIGKED